MTNDKADIIVLSITLVLHIFVGAMIMLELSSIQPQTHHLYINLLICALFINIATCFRECAGFVYITRD
jgi:hypothetical protein